MMHGSPTYLALLLSLLALACAPTRPAAPPELPTTPIEIVAPAVPLDTPLLVRKGSFVRTRANADALRLRFRRELEAARVFSSVLDAAPPDPAGVWDLILTAADYGEPNAYTFELQALIVQGRDPVKSYVSKQSVRQTGRGQLTIGPTELGQLAERAIRDIVRQLAADTEQLRTAR